MNTPKQTCYEPLEAHIRAARQHQPTTDETDQAQQRLLRRLHGTKPKPGVRALPRLWAPALAMALFLVPVLVLLPGQNNGLAFADVQAYFQRFETLSARLTTTINGSTVMTMQIAVDTQNRTRLDAGEQFSFVIDPEQQRMLQLFHPQRRGVFVDLPDSQGHVAEMAWLDQLRDYQGQAERLSEARVINGVASTGFALQTASLDMRLWANDSGQPVLLEIRPDGPQQPSINIAFQFDQPMDAARFQLKVPDGFLTNTATPQH